MTPAKVVVAMSGGVDSSVAAALLVRRGYDVLGITLDIWFPEDEAERAAATCCGFAASEDARRVCHKLDIPHYVLNFRDIFERAVIDDFCAEYGRGRTPNPCIRCNELVKFDALMARARALGADLLATGHYAMITADGGDSYCLRKGRDEAKDQSYFLYMLNQELMGHLLFPVGGMTKTEVRSEARRLGLRVADKPESQEVCFVTGGRYSEFVRSRVGGTGGGDMVTANGDVVGRHNGLEGFTVGQRKGLGAHPGGPKYVVAVDAESNRVVIGGNSELFARRFTASDARWCQSTPTQRLATTAKVRYNMREESATVEPTADGGLLVCFEEPQRAVTPGQAAVFYRQDVVLGGATIEAVERV